MTTKKKKKDNNTNSQKSKPIGQVKDVTTTIKGIFELDKKTKN